MERSIALAHGLFACGLTKNYTAITSPNRPSTLPVRSTCQPLCDLIIPVPSPHTPPLRRACAPRARPTTPPHTLITHRRTRITPPDIYIRRWHLPLPAQSTPFPASPQEPHPSPYAPHRPRTVHPSPYGVPACPTRSLPVEIPWSRLTVCCTPLDQTTRHLDNGSVRGENPERFAKKQKSTSPNRSPPVHQFGHSPAHHPRLPDHTTRATGNLGKAQQ